MAMFLVNVGEKYLNLDHLISADWQPSAKEGQMQLLLLFNAPKQTAQGIQPFSICIPGKNGHILKAELDRRVALAIASRPDDEETHD